MKEELKFEVQEELDLGTRIKVIGVGGGGSNAVARMMSEGIGGVEFFVLNTDMQALGTSSVANKLVIGQKITHGRGVGSDPALGRLAALEDTERIIEILQGADMVFVTAGMGGGTGTGAAPVIAALAKELNALTIAVVTKPFSFEGPRRMKQADKGLADLAASVDTVISIPNDKLLDVLPKGTGVMDAFRAADDVLRQAVEGISDIINTPGMINRDFSDIRAIMLGMGYATMGTATARGENAAVEAARQAISCRMLEDGGVKGAKAILINITASSKLGIHDINEACNLIRNAAEYEDVQINFGIVLKEDLDDEVKITVIATGFQREGLPAIDRSAAPEQRTISAPLAAPRFEAPRRRLVEPEPAPVALAVAAPSAELQTSPEPREVEAEVMAADEPGQDLEMPAYLRRERRLFQ
ncbi:MAG: cell division protein FtsZ [Acidobacteria bacterium]|nr:cell division protein FtsZ [Acidobacteriota bacterium]